MYKCRVILLPLAKQDIRTAAHWYNARHKGLGKRFTAEIRKKIKFIRENPEAIAVRYEDVRTAVIDVFPFMLHYFFNKEQTEIVILGVFHTSLNPERWKRV